MKVVKRSGATMSWLPAIVTLAGFALFAQEADRPIDPPNVVFILADDLGYGDLDLQLGGIDVFANPYVRTPNLARLAAQSLVFTHHYASAPVCSPSRAGLLTGRIPGRYNIPIWIRDTRDDDQIFLPGKATTIPELLKGAGYQTAVFGKWHLNGADWEQRANWTGWTGSFPNQQGFDEAMVSKENPHESRKLLHNAQRNPGDFFLADDEAVGQPMGAIKGFSSSIIVDAALKWLSARDQEKPFFLYLPFDAVHEKVENPEAFNTLFDSGDIDKNKYYGNVAYLDAQIGRVMDFLYAHQLDEQTIVFFSSDHGPEVWNVYRNAIHSFGSSAPLFGQKRQLYEGGIRVPGIVRWVGKIDPGVSSLPNSTLDVLPTLCELAGVEIPREVEPDGVSLVPHLLERQDVQRTQPLYWQNTLREHWRTVGAGYDRRYDGAQPTKTPTPVAAVRQGSYVLRGFLRDEAAARPSIFQLHDVVLDVEESVELSQFEPTRFESMKAELLRLWDSVNSEAEGVRREIAQRVDQR